MAPCRTVAAVALIAAGVLFQPPARAQSEAAARKAILAIFAARDSARQKKDLDGSLCNLSREFVVVTSDGQKGDAAYLKRRMGPLVSMAQDVKSRTSIVKFASKGKSATDTSKVHIELIAMSGQTQMPQRYVVDATIVDSWVYADARWVESRMVTKSQTVTVNGKRVEAPRAKGKGPGAARRPRMGGGK
ncbi:MAG TPA: hypothetical protein VKT77_06690 [Chthonomonadaceae bacterium]|nr:hypothetical protein [Chthonomonadaceae bacterium]